MENISRKRYKIYEYIRDNDEITAEMSNTKRLIKELAEDDIYTKDYCNRKVMEEKNEVEEAMIGEHFHKNMTKREILVNEISQYLYWLTIIAVSKYVTYEEFDIDSKIGKILDRIDITKIGETKQIMFEEIIMHDIEDMEKKDYLKAVVNQTEIRIYIKPDFGLYKTKFQLTLAVNSQL